MIKPKFSIKGTIFTAKTKTALDASLHDRLGRAGAVVEAQAKVLVSKAGSPPASAPGQPPHRNTGNLMNSIRFEFVGATTVAVGPSVFYGGFLEHGTRRAGARPFMRPALLMSVSKFPQIFKGLL